MNQIASRTAKSLREPTGKMVRPNPDRRKPVRCDATAATTPSHQAVATTTQPASRDRPMPRAAMRAPLCAVGFTIRIVGK